MKQGRKQMQQTNAPEREVVFVVGDRFAGFANKPGTVVASELSRALTEGETERFGPEMSFVPGQGLCEDRMRRLLAEAKESRVDAAFDAWEEAMKAPKACGSLTHKRNPENVLIGDPRQLGDGLFEADLRIDDRNEIMSDHVTGQHLQGMLLVEACRQTFLAVTEKYFAPTGEQRSYYYVINELNTAYYSFAFPLGAKITYTINDRSTEDPERLSFDVSMDVVQTGEVVTRVETSFTAFDSASLKPKEPARREDPGPLASRRRRRGLERDLRAGESRGGWGHRYGGRW